VFLFNYIFHHLVWHEINTKKSIRSIAKQFLEKIVLFGIINPNNLCYITSGLLMKIAAILACSIVLVFNGMESAQQRLSKIKHKQLPIISQQKDKKRMNEQKESSLIFSVLLLPQEVRRTIIARTLFNEIQSVQLFEAMPTLTSLKYYQQVKPYDSLRVGNKIYSIDVLFRLAVSSPTQFEELVDIAQPPIIDRLIMGIKYDLVTAHEYKKIPQMPTDISEGLELKVINESYLQGCRQLAACYCAGTCFFFCINLSAIATMFGCCIGIGCCCTHHHCIEQNAVSVKL
jgi:hypothetical protein